MAPITKDGLAAAWRRAVASAVLTPRDRKGLEGVFNYITHATAVPVPSYDSATRTTAYRLWAALGIGTLAIVMYFVWLVIDMLLS